MEAAWSWTRTLPATPTEEVPPMSPEARAKAHCISGNEHCGYAGSSFTCCTCGAKVCWCEGGTEDRYRAFMCATCANL